MKKLLYILLALPLLTACREKKETAGAAAMYTPEVSVASPLIKDITLSCFSLSNLPSIKTM